MKKSNSASYWFFTLACAYGLLWIMTSALMDPETLLHVFRFERRFETPLDMANSVLVQGMKPCTIIAGMLCAAMYNYRCGRVLLSMNETHFAGENVLACMLCALVGGTAAAYYLLMLSTLGFTMLIVGGCLAWASAPLLAVFCGMDRLEANAVKALHGAALAYPRLSRVRVHTLQGAFRGIFDCSSRPFRLVVTTIFFTSLSMLMHGLLEGPLKQIMSEAADYAAVMDKPFWESMAHLAALSAPYLPMVSGLFCAVFFERLFAAPLQRYLHPLCILLAFGPPMAVFSLAALLVLTLAGVYSLFLLLITGAVILAVCSRSPRIAIALTVRMIIRSHVTYEESMTLKVFLLIGLMLPFLFLFAGG